MSAAADWAAVRAVNRDHVQLRFGAPARAWPAAVADGEPFAEYVAHELRTPIALQRALVEVTLADPHADAAALREMGERVVASCIRQQRLIEALLDLGRCRRGPTRREPVDLAAIAAEALRAQDLREVEAVAALEPAPTRGDPDLVELLIGNLVSNAVDHNLPGGRLEIATRTSPTHAHLIVANTGRPVPASELARLFQPFQRLHSSWSDAGGGVGLGLAIVEAIAASHGAPVAARARAGGGLEIDVGFPASR